ncbi:TlpA disulfide reductase family protein [Virgibacillus sp. DJP39]|uniref:TlpA disulfide reductase family protein n=1 Tax=Virgibacillus sp. DJP39 TaxID=3409790 RepID=UPI003BB767D7
MQTLNGEKARLSNYRGQRVMVNFWATWCPPCRAEMPDMEKFHQDKEVVILAVNLTQTESGIMGVKDFVKEFNLTFPILLDEEIKVATNYQIRPIPSSFMIDSNGVIQFKSFGPLTSDMMVEEFEKMQ